MSSGKNSKDSKIARLLTRQAEDGACLKSIDGVARAILRKTERLLAQQTASDNGLINVEATLRLNHETDQVEIARLSGSVERLTNSLKLATEMAHRLEAENGRLRKYLGSDLYARRLREMQIPTLPLPCGCSDKSDGTPCPHSGATLEPRFGNRA